MWNLAKSEHSSISGAALAWLRDLHKHFLHLKKCLEPGPRERICWQLTTCCCCWNWFRTWTSNTTCSGRSLVPNVHSISRYSMYKTLSLFFVVWKWLNYLLPTPSPHTQRWRKSLSEEWDASYNPFNKHFNGEDNVSRLQMSSIVSAWTGHEFSLDSRDLKIKWLLWSESDPWTLETWCLWAAVIMEMKTWAVFIIHQFQVIVAQILPISPDSRCPWDVTMIEQSKI